MLAIAPPVAVDSRTAIGGNEIPTTHETAFDHPLLSQLDADGLQELFMNQSGSGVHEVETRAVGVHAEQNELEVVLAEGDRLECFQIGNGQCAGGEFHGRGRVHRVHAHRVEFGEVVDAVAVDVGRVGDEVLLHPVALGGQGLDVLGERGRARFAPLDQDRCLYRRAIHFVPDVEHEVLVGRGRDHDGHRRHFHFHRRRGVAAF